MRIQHNIAALNSYRNLTSNNGAVSKNLEKLSSGYRINRAGDDAAGLAISEKMRAQITGLKTAQKNANDGISLIQTAEGALTEVHSMLNRMVELADQSANGTYQDKVDRENIQKEMDSLKDEIDRISEGTNFNGIKLLDGSMGNASSGASYKLAADDATSKIKAFEATVTGQAGLQVEFKAAAAGAHGVTAAWSGDKISITMTGKTGGADSFTEKEINDAIAKATGTKPEGASSINIKIKNGKIDSSAATEAATVGTAVTLAESKYSSVTSDGITISATKGGAAYDGAHTISAGTTEGATVDTSDNTFSLSLVSGSSYTAADINSMLNAAGADYRFDFEGTKTGTAIAAMGSKSTAGGAGVSGAGLQLQIGESAESFNQLNVSVDSMSSTALGISGVDVSTQSGSKAAVDILKNAINTVSSTRGDLGALQNRLEHTINNLSVTTENMTAAESRIRDVDMADEMMNYTKNNILVQASQAMLAQANQIPQGVLQLLQ